MSFSSLILQISLEGIHYLPKVKKSGCVSIAMCGYMSYVKSTTVLLWEEDWPARAKYFSLETPSAFLKNGFGCSWKPLSRSENHTQRKQAKPAVLGSILLLHCSCGFSLMFRMKHKEGGKKVEWLGETQKGSPKCYPHWVLYIGKAGADNSNTK